MQLEEAPHKTPKIEAPAELSIEDENMNIYLKAKAKGKTVGSFDFMVAQAKLAGDLKELKDVAPWAKSLGITDITTAEYAFKASPELRVLEELRNKEILEKMGPERDVALEDIAKVMALRKAQQRSKDKSEAPADKPMTRLEYIQSKLDQNPKYQKLREKFLASKGKERKQVSQEMSKMEEDMKTIVPVKEKGFDYRQLDEDTELNREFQDVLASKLPLAKDKKEWAERVKAKLRKDFPNIAGIEVDEIIDRLTGEEKAGQAFNMIAQWAKGKATIDTAPHEYFHILVKA